MVISEEEEKSIREKIRKELEIKEQERIEALKSAKQAEEEEQNRLRETEDEKGDYLKRLEITEDEKNKFYKEKGFIPVKDASGNLKWLSPEEYEKKKHKIKNHRSKRRKEEEEIEDKEKSEIVVKNQISSSLKNIYIAAIVIFL